jgi:hypothetical protein
MSLRQSSSLETSVTQINVSAPMAVISCSSKESRLALRAARTTLLPFRANSSAVALPIPEDAPVTITTLSRKILRLICSQMDDKYNEIFGKRADFFLIAKFFALHLHSQKKGQIQ